ncbi:MAG: carbohydrate kinase family protein [Hungatella sp.]|jgi:ribokinase|nr:carbohydrate kinase family protein [Hungatella sp.]
MGFVAGMGIINCDLLYSGLDAIPNEGEEVFSKRFDIQLGGGNPAIMVNLSRLKIPVQMVTFLGKDLFSNHMQILLERQGIRYTNLYEGDGMPLNITSVAVTKRDRTFLTYMGRVTLKEEDVDQIYRQFTGAKLVRMYCDLENEKLLQMYVRLKEEGSILTMDTGWEDDLSVEKYRKYLELADYYTPNEMEALKITGTSSVPEAARVLSGFFDEVIIKLGKNGCYYQGKGKTRTLKPLEHVDAVDATGAGDAFMAGFMYGLYHDYSTEDCIRLGNVMGGYCVQAVGCLTRFPTEEELLKYVKEERL